MESPLTSAGPKKRLQDPLPATLPASGKLSVAWVLSPDAEAA